MKKKIISAALAAAVGMSAAASALAPIGAAAASTTYLVSSAAPSGALASETEIPTNISGMKLTVGADTYEVKSANVTYNGITYTNSIGGKANPKPTDGTGTYYRFTFDDSIEDGTLEVMYKLGANKALHIQEDGKEIDGYPLTVAEGAVQSSTFKVSAGHEYLVYAQGSKLLFYGCTYKVINKEKDFENEIQGLSFDLIKGDNADEAHIDSDLDLIQAYESQFGSCDVAWTSSNQDIINNGGVVSAAAEDTVVEFTGKFSVQEDDSLVQYKTFSLTVLGDADDAAAVAAAKDALTLGDTSSVKKDIELPSRGKRSTGITWSTSDESVVTADGVVTRAPGQDKTAVLTATVSRNGVSDTKDFNVTVAGYEALTLDSFVFADAAGNTKFSPVDGGTLKTIFVTSGMKDISDGDSIIVTVKGSEGTVKGIKQIPLTADYYDVSTKADVDIAMDADDKFTVTLGNGDNIYTAIDQPDLAPVNGATIYVIGDSTASQYQDNNYPRKGWAQMLQNYFNDSEIKVNDLALSGRSSLSFKSDANFQTYKNSVKAGDYLIVQFGHNDSKAEDSARYTDAKTDRFTDGSFKKSMLEYINIARDKGAYPILATSISRRKTGDASLESYVRAAKELGEEIGIPVIDLYKRTNAYINEVGLETAKDMFNYVKIRDSRFYNYPNFAKSGFYSTGTTDDTHININGADLISQWAAEELKELAVPLSIRVNDYQAVYPLPSYADAETMDASATFYPEATATPEPTAAPEVTEQPTEAPIRIKYDPATNSVPINIPEKAADGTQITILVIPTDKKESYTDDDVVFYIDQGTKESIPEKALLKGTRLPNGTYSMLMGYYDVDKNFYIQEYVFDVKYAVSFELDGNMSVAAYADETLSEILSSPYNTDDELYFVVSYEIAPGSGTFRINSDNGKLEFVRYIDSPEDMPQSYHTVNALYHLTNVTSDATVKAYRYSGPIFDFSADKKADGSVRTQANAGYANASAPNGTVIIAAYDDTGRLYGAKTFKPLEEAAVYKWEDLPDDVHTFKAVWVNDLEHMEPVCEVLAVTVE